MSLLLATTLRTLLIFPDPGIDLVPATLLKEKKLSPEKQPKVTEAANLTWILKVSESKWNFSSDLLFQGLLYICQQEPLFKSHGDKASHHLLFKLTSHNPLDLKLLTVKFNCFGLLWVLLTFTYKRYSSPTNHAVIPVTSFQASSWRLPSSAGEALPSPQLPF